MALILADRVQETTNTTGTGTLTLAGAVAGYQSFAAIGNGNTTYYTIVSGTAWENGIGTYTSSGTTLARTTILSSTNSNTAINVAAGASVFVTSPAERTSFFYRLDSALAGANATGAQNLLGVGITLSGSTVYEFEIVVPMSKTAGTNSHAISLLFGGTATLNNIAYQLTGLFKSTGFTGITPPDVVLYSQVATATTVTAVTTGATVQFVGLIKGTVSVNASGTFIPQYSLSNAPGGAYTTALGAYMKITPLTASGANVSIGPWA